MTPKEKAREIVDKYTNELFDAGREISKPLVKRIASIYCRDIMKHAKDISMVYDLSFDESTSYWQQVKDEIEKL
jgi:hypothetical protein